jgi:phosphoethanolamine N-methyltransferase
MTEAHEDEYSPEILEVLEFLWGKGFLSPGGEEHLAAIVGELDLRDRSVLDIGCALAGFDLLLAKKYGARVVGLDVEAALIERGRKSVLAAGLEDQIELKLYEPGKLPFEDGSFDVVFGKDSWIHIEDKRAFFAEVYRVLVPGGFLIAGDWLRSDREYDEDMYRFFELERLTYHMDTLPHYGAILREAGFVDVSLEDIHDQYRIMAGEELRRLEVDDADEIVRRIGEEAHQYFILNWQALVKVVENGDLRPGRMRARKAG